MEEWAVLRTLRDAHYVGLAMMDSFARAAEDLKEGRRAEALEVFEKTLDFFDGHLKLHFDHEERALFPVMRRILGPAGPVEGMVKEHDSFWCCVDDFVDEMAALHNDVVAGNDRYVAKLHRMANHIVWMLRSHIDKENTMLFPLAEKIMDEPAKREVALNLEMVDRLAGQVPRNG